MLKKPISIRHLPRMIRRDEKIEKSILYDALSLDDQVWKQALKHQANVDRIKKAKKLKQDYFSWLKFYKDFDPRKFKILNELGFNEYYRKKTGSVLC